MHDGRRPMAPAGDWLAWRFCRALTGVSLERGARRHDHGGNRLEIPATRASRQLQVTHLKHFMTIKRPTKPSERAARHG
jgi:hypothetical protein